MSYILDALRRSDQQRQRGAVPTLLTAQAATVAPKQPAYLFYGLIAAVLISAGIAIGWLRPWQSEPIAAKPPESVPRQAAPTPLPALPEIARKPERQPSAQKSTSAAQRAPARAAMKRGTPPEAAAAVPKAAATHMPEQFAGTGPAGAAQEQRVMTMAELPLAIQQELPAMSVSVHAYSGQPQSRLVGINERMLREGGYVVPGLRLEQITPDGMIFSYKGYRFSRGVKGSGSKAENQ